MKKYEAPTSEVILVNCDDVISTSPTDSPIVDADDWLEVQ